MFWIGEKRRYGPLTYITRTSLAETVCRCAARHRCLILSWKRARTGYIVLELNSIRESGKLKTIELSFPRVIVASLRAHAIKCKRRLS